eukprot:7265227-Heterocapsa_arctica.AAC.1
MPPLRQPRTTSTLIWLSVAKPASLPRSRSRLSEWRASRTCLRDRITVPVFSVAPMASALPRPARAPRGSVLLCTP